MGYPGDQQPRHMPYRPQEDSRQAGDPRREAETNDPAGEPMSWPPAEEHDAGQRTWSRMEDRRRRAHGHTSGDGGADPTFGLGRPMSGDVPLGSERPPAGERPPGSDPAFGMGPTFGGTQGGRPFETRQAQGSGLGEPGRGVPSFETRQTSGRPFEEPGTRQPFEPRKAQERPFEDLGRRPFEAPASHTGPFNAPPAQTGLFTPPPSQTGPFTLPPSQTGPLNAPPSQTGPLNAPPAHTGPFEARGVQTGSFEARQPLTQQPPAGRSGDLRSPTMPVEASGPRTGSFEEQGSERLSRAKRPPAQPPKGTRRQEPVPGGRRSRTRLFVTGGVVVLLIAVGAGIIVMNRGEDPVTTASAPASRPTAQAPLVGTPAGKYGFAGSRKTDPQPLTLKELFGHRKVTAHGRAYLMTVRRADKKCDNAVHGTSLQKALTAGRCTQVLRASFRDGPGKLIGTIGVANLKTAVSAKKAAKAGTGGELEDYVNPLQGKDSATKFLGSGGDSYATAWAQGHYLVLLWFQYKDGHKPTKAELKGLNRAAVDITEKSVFSALDTRALTGARSG